jgi:hypothetical protein
MKRRKSVRGFGPSRTVHKTILQAQQTAIENIGCLRSALSVHLNEFSWTRHTVPGGGE